MPKRFDSPPVHLLASAALVLVQKISFSVDSIGFWNGVMLVSAYDFYPPVTDLLGEVVTGWAIVGTFLVLLSLV